MAAIDPAGIDVFEDPGTGRAYEKYTRAFDLDRLAGPSTVFFLFFFLLLSFVLFCFYHLHLSLMF